jgi:DNA repair protein RadC
MSAGSRRSAAEQGSAAPLFAPAASLCVRRARRRIATLRLVREGSFVAPNEYPEAHIPLRSPRDVFLLMEPFAAREVGESFWILALDAQHRVSAPTVITRGILTASLVHPREVFQAAIVAGAAAIVLCHNHPSGDPTPSPDDRAVTDQLVAAGRLLDIPVHDHVILGCGRYTSFAEAGLL